MKISKKYGYMIMSIKDKKEVVIDEVGKPFPPDCTQRENEEVFNRLRERSKNLSTYCLILSWKLVMAEEKR